MTKISDFKIAELIIKKLCKQKDCLFVDMYLCFEEPDGNLRTDCMTIGDSDNIGQTSYKIVQNYVDNYNQIDGKQLFDNESGKRNFLISTANFLRGLVYADAGDNVPDKDFAASRLYNNVAVWTLLKDLICPIYHKNLINYQVIAGSDPSIDVAKYYKSGSLDGVKPDTPFLFLNTDVQNTPVRDAFLFVSALESLELDPSKVVNEICESELSDKFLGIIKLAFDRQDDSDMFLLTIFNILGLETDKFPGFELDKYAFSISKLTKLGQEFKNPMMWWYFGVIEKLLEPARGDDWTVYETLEPEIKEFWNKVETYRQKKRNSIEGVPFDMLLRLKQDDSTDATRTLQSLLGSQRIW